MSETVTTAYTVDTKGFIVDVILVDTSEEVPEMAILDKIENYYHKPRWNGSEWVEGESAEEKSNREAQQLLESLKPSPQELADAEIEIKMITMLTEMGVIQ